eukprot:CAMPEP_0172905602 /NCGR_PEP_ID=MMETSP1075-20121228/175001_1 /TAXON_ID=2916 /ORGANISM="Ceratium fusus, Strain PA161109" /LENGTH=537 /DNA_ID=CAMNT_0013762863 /DNA_START=26 /DNA_END=1635 /DNA_ORIENTATION=+
MTTLNPKWNWSGELPVHRPSAVIRVVVLDHDVVGDDDLLGFVELPIADLPIGKFVAGWFTLLPADRLQGTAPERVAISMFEKPKETCGSVYLELMLDTLSGDPSDEFYAWCLDPPNFKEFSRTGYFKKLNAQAISDTAMDLKFAVFDQFARPFMAGLTYILMWREKILSMAALLLALGVSLRPAFIPAAIVALPGAVLLLLSNETRRRRMATDPSSVALDDMGYTLVAELCDTNAMRDFLERVVVAMHGTVHQPDLLRQFAAFCWDGGRPVTTLANLKQQLRRAAADLPEHPFVSFSPAALQIGSLVVAGGRSGEVISCVRQPNMSQGGCYEVRFGPEAIEELDGESLEIRPDFRWISNPVVLALIPDDLETALMEDLLLPLEFAQMYVRLVVDLVNYLFSWKRYDASLATATLCFATAGLLALPAYHGLPTWVSVTVSFAQVVACLSLVVIIFVAKSRLMICLQACIRAHVKYRAHSSKRAMDWPFFEEDHAINARRSSSEQRRSLFEEDFAMGPPEPEFCWSFRQVGRSSSTCFT